MRYPDEGGLTAEQRKRREEVCMRAADLFEEDVKVPCVARELRVSEKSVDQWRRAWASGGREALRSQGPAPPAASGVRPGERSQEPSPVVSSAGRRGEFRRPGGPAVCCCRRRSWRWATAPARASPSPGG
ncbi:helix-turn-helix domain-containing protein [Streptomyces mirabilis]